ncbi:MAG: UvrD-helicase domain-containing protein [Acidimicrobiales bacterium]
MSDFTPPDQGARDRIVKDLGATLFVEAGAGSGKTTALVDRVLALVETGSAELANMAAITFTEKAATELRDRLRREIERKIVAKPSGERADRLRLALEQLDGAAIGTLHSFAQRILTEHPIEAGLPPRVEVSDEVSSDVAFDARWRSFCDELLADPEYERTILVMVAANVRFESLRLLAAAFNDNWDLVEERVPETSPEPPDVHAAVASVLDDLDRICCEPCDDDGDSLRLHLDDIAEYVAWLRTIPDELDLLEALGEKGPRKRPTFKVANRGKKEAWPNGVAELRARVREAGDRLIQIPADAASAAVKRLGTVLRRFTLDEAEKRRKAGELEFHDLLVIARSLLRDPEVGAAVRKYLHARYERLLLDEFQDTDPIQVEIAVLIAATDPGLGGADAAEIQWDAVEVAPGHLFFVGDPKQSIYRFRRADIAMFLNASRRFGTATDGTVELSANFRTAAPIIDWINATFGCLIDVAGEADLPVPSQPRYASLDAVRPAPPSGPAVARIGALAHVDGVNADGIRAREAADVVAAVSRAVQEGWSVETEDGQWRPARLGDITILVPARTSLPFLEEGLDTAGIPYRAESNSLVYSSRAVRDLLMIVRVIADPTNGLHLLAALRTPLFACGDDDLFRFRCERGGHWSYLREQPDTVPADDPVLRCLEYLRSLWEQRYWLAPSELLDLITRDRRAMDLGFAEGRPRDVWRRLRFVVDQARAWDEATGGNLRQYLDWVAMQTAEGARVAEAVLPETDDDAVRIMTIHAAKGLEFPITIVSGMSTAPRLRPAQAEVVFPPSGPVGYKVGSSVKTDEYLEWAPIDEQMSYHERIRLLYVACTRARDHLVVSTHRKVRTSEPPPENRTNAELLVAGMGDLFDELADLGVETEGVIPPAATEPPPLMPEDEWRAQLTAALDRASRPTTVSATSLTEEGEPDVEEEPDDPGLQKRPRDLDLPPWLKGRYGTAIGRAVHGVLQAIDLATGEGLHAAVASQCEAEAVVDRADEVQRLVAAALGSPSVRAAAASRHWKELYVCAPLGDRQLEGYIDLLYRGHDGLVVVDYKTSATSDPTELAVRVEGYRVQGASYALVVGAATGEPVTKVTFVFLTPDGAIELDLPDLGPAMNEVDELVG